MLACVHCLWRVPQVEPAIRPSAHGVDQQLSKALIFGERVELHQLWHVIGSLEHQHCQAGCLRLHKRWLAVQVPDQADVDHTSGMQPSIMPCAQDGLIRAIPTAVLGPGQAHQEQRSVVRAGLVTMQAWQVRCVVDHQHCYFSYDCGQATVHGVRGREIMVRVPLAQAVEDLRRHMQTCSSKRRGWALHACQHRKH